MKRRDFLKGVAMLFGVPLAAKTKNPRVFRNWVCNAEPIQQRINTITVLGECDVVQVAFPLEPAWHVTKLEC